MAEVKAKPLDPLLVLILLLLAIMLAQLGVFNPLYVGLVGVVGIFLLLIMPIFEKVGIITKGEQKFLYTIFVIFLCLFIYGLEEKGYLPLMALTGNITVDAILSMGMYTLLLILVIVGLIAYYYREQLKKYFK